MNNSTNQNKSTVPFKLEFSLMKSWILGLFILSMLIAGCNETIKVGSEILPNSDGLGNAFTDTSTVISTTVREDSLRSDKLFLSQLGYMNDQTFGTTKSSLLMGFRTPNITVNPSVLDDVGGYQLDSIVLALTINGIYGDSTKPMSFKVYKLLESLDEDQVYFSNIEFDQGMLEVGSVENYIPTQSNNFAEDTTYTGLASQLRIRLNPFFGQSIINLIESDLLDIDENVRLYLPGLVVVPEEQDGSIIELNMLSNAFETERRNALQDSRLHVFYKNSDGDALNIMLPTSSSNLGISQYIHDYNSTDVETALNSNNPLGDEFNYIQGLAGVKTKVEIPYIKSYGNIAVNKAELVVTQIPNTLEETFLPPDRLFVLNIGKDSITSADINENISDFTYFSDNHTDGFSNEVGGTLQYRINISNYIQEIISGKKDNGEELLNNGMYISLYGAQDLTLTSINSSDLFPDRVVIGGGSNTMDDYRLKLEMTYTILD